MIKPRTCSANLPLNLWIIHRALKLLVRETVTLPVARFAVLDLVYTTDPFLVVVCGGDWTFASQQRWLVS